MKILYTISNPYGLGADRWIYEGYRHAFLVAGHEFSILTETDDFEKVVLREKPDLFFLDFCFVERYSRQTKLIAPEFFQKLQNQGTKIFTMVGGEDKEESSSQRIAFFKRFVPFFDICFSNHAPEVTKNLEPLFGKKIYFIPHAADTAYYFPDKPDKNFICDIAFVGSFYTHKKEKFEKLLFPLFKKYYVRLYGTGWTKKDRILRLGSGLGRKLKIKWLTKFVNKQRVTISPEDERKLYASAKICVNIHEYYKDGTIKGISNEREFKVPAAGGFEISDYIPGMERYFEIGKEIVAVKTSEEWFKAIDFYLKNEKERKEIRERGTKRVLREHTYHHRVKRILALYNSLKHE